MSDYQPFEERVYAFFSNEIAFSAEDVQHRFPDENIRKIYRALNNLEKTNRIRFSNWYDKKKVYTSAGQSSLPMLRNARGEAIPLGTITQNIESMYDGDRLISLSEINKIYVIMSQLFTIAQHEDLSEMKRDFLLTHSALIDMREWLLRQISNIDAVIKHPSCQGDMEVFKATFSGNDPAMPTPEELLKFRRWTYTTFGGTDD